MGISIRASDLKYRYPKVVSTRFAPKFAGSGDREPFNRDDLYDIIPVLEAAMDHLERDDATTLHFMEDLMNQDLPRFLNTRAEVFDFLTGCTKEMLELSR
ncbi:hypothetical protein Gbem_2230 [Citrifermentans bemidjiense Bem]|uniref:Uncharacterized protein n=1 Tax=Citrifermentans bemidjiense (strain ATCC BAA-1014 / DSM 16622 / JCM 12645 / Bem) TaxID=404380 RepID=B5EE97_CITBB|nr:hypothetical protein [Citrifermentans bemidjiense]ACH39242.1 hypothetical protein Gbem_2230 [Citrifermentans bemidjiense Bem]